MCLNRFLYPEVPTPKAPPPEEEESEEDLSDLVLPIVIVFVTAAVIVYLAYRQGIWFDTGIHR